jgi:hypothetical protein
MPGLRAHHLPALVALVGFVAGAGVARGQAPAGSAADTPTVGATVEPAKGQIGDQLTLTVTAVGPRSIPTNLPANRSLGAFEVVGGDPEVADKDLGDGKISRTFRVKIAAYETGELTVPPIPVTYIGKGGTVLSQRTKPVPVKIESLLANETEPQLKEAQTPESVVVLEDDYTLVYAGGGLMAAILGALLALYLRRRLRARAAFRPAPPPRPAHEVALEKLDRLATSGLLPGADLRPFYFQLTEVVREYLGARFGFLALEMTSEEVIAQLQRRRQLRGLVMGEIAGWVISADMVKFAKLVPSEDEARGALETAIRIVESTRPRPQPQIGAPGSAAAPGSSGEGPGPGPGGGAGETPADGRPATTATEAVGS